MYRNYNFFSARVAIGGMKKYDPVSPAFKELKWLRVKEKYFLDSATMYKFLNKMFPAWFLSYPTIRGTASSVARQRNSLVVPWTKTASGVRAFLVNGPKMWNSLPANATTATTLSCCKSKVTKYLLEAPTGDSCWKFITVLSWWHNCHCFIVTFNESSFSFSMRLIV